MNEWQVHTKKMVDAETLRMRWRLVASDPPPEDTQLLLYGSWHSLDEAQYPQMWPYADSLQVYCGAFEKSHSRNGGKTWQDKWGDKFHAPVYWMPLPKPPGHKD